MIKKPGLAGLALVLVAFLFLLVSRTWRSRRETRSDAKGREAHPNEWNVATYSDPQDFWKHLTESTSLKVNPPEYPLMIINVVYHPLGDCICMRSARRFQRWRHNAKATQAVRAELALEEESWKVPSDCGTCDSQKLT